MLGGKIRINGGHFTKLNNPILSPEMKPVVQCLTAHTLPLGDKAISVFPINFTSLAVPELFSLY